MIDKYANVFQNASGTPSVVEGNYEVACRRGGEEGMNVMRIDYCLAVG